MTSSRRAARLRHLVHRAAHQVAEATARAGIHVVPRRYYSSEPDRHWLRRHRSYWQGPLQMPGVHWDLDAQLLWLKDTCGEHLAEVSAGHAYERFTRSELGLGFGPIEAQVLHCFIRHHAPRRVVEIGAGVSTAVMADAARRNGEEGRTTPAITTIDPHVSDAVEDLPGVTVLAELAQAVDPDVFLGLEPGDLLFIDSTHSVKTGSELARLYIDVIPSLAPGVWIHVHDIFLPYPYMPTVLDQLWDWQESVLLAALLTGNSGLRAACSLTALHTERSSDLAAVIPAYRPAPHDRGLLEWPRDDRHHPASLWLEVVGQ
jgi:predicted O-methyltransferase YrrM